MYHIIDLDSDRTVFSSEFLDDIDEWFLDSEVNPQSLRYEVIFESIEEDE